MSNTLPFLKEMMSLSTEDKARLKELQAKKAKKHKRAKTKKARTTHHSQALEQETSDEDLEKAREKAFQEEVSKLRDKQEENREAEMQSQQALTYAESLNDIYTRPSTREIDYGSVEDSSTLDSAPKSSSAVDDSLDSVISEDLNSSEY